MPDTKEGRERRARDAENRQREREIMEAVARADEAEPPREIPEDSDSPPECHRRGCPERAAFLVLERYQEETGKGAVEARAFLCREHTAEEGPVNLDDAYPEYVFRVDPLPGVWDPDGDSG
jgi:hypothetical protein